MAVLLPPSDPLAAPGLAAYVAAFRGVFARADQFRWFVAYLDGLLADGPRKNIESLARRLPPSPAAADPAQALQHFVSHSPWDADQLLARYREWLGPRLADPAAVWAVHDGVFPKRGMRSVGVRRQLARPLGQKVNCQVAVVVAQVGPAGYFPLAVRLYLPRPAAGDRRAWASKSDIALSLIDALAAEGRSPAAVAADDGYDLADGLSARGLPATGDGAAVAEALERFEWLKGRLGLDHFEGRGWRGWHHHVSLVVAAYGHLAAGADISTQI